MGDEKLCNTFDKSVESQKRGAMVLKIDGYSHSCEFGILTVTTRKPLLTVHGAVTDDSSKNQQTSPDTTTENYAYILRVQKLKNLGPTTLANRKSPKKCVQIKEWMEMDCMEACLKIPHGTH